MAEGISMTQRKDLEKAIVDQFRQQHRVDLPLPSHVTAVTSKLDSTLQAASP